MLTIGMGKIIGATTLHTYGMDMFGELLPKTAKFTMSKINFVFGVGMVENAADETAIIEVVPAEQVLDREPVLQAKAKEFMPRLQFDEIDVLVVEKIGKNISGSGMDPNITGRNARFVEWNMKPFVKKIAVLALTPETHGNATTYLDGAAIPIIMNTDQEAIQLVAKTVVRVKPEDTKIVRIATTLDVLDIHVSEPMLPFIKANPSMFEIVGEPEAFKFDAKGNLYPMLAPKREHAPA